MFTCYKTCCSFYLTLSYLLNPFTMYDDWLRLHLPPFCGFVFMYLSVVSSDFSEKIFCISFFCMKNLSYYVCIIRCDLVIPIFSLLYFVMYPNVSVILSYFVLSFSNSVFLMMFIWAACLNDLTFLLNFNSPVCIFFITIFTQNNKIIHSIGASFASKFYVMYFQFYGFFTTALTSIIVTT